LYRFEGREEEAEVEFDEIDIGHGESNVAVEDDTLVEDGVEKIGEIDLFARESVELVRSELVGRGVRRHE
jgi:hypothetical protein